MKKVLSLVLALVLVLGSFPAFAAEAEMTAGEKLKDAGFITGGEGGDLMADKPLKRGELASLIAELNGVKEEAKNYEGTSDLTDIADHWSKNYVNYGVKQGWWEGYPDKTYRPEDVVTGQALQKVLLDVLGYDVEWDTVPATANTLDLTVPTGEMLRGDAFKTVWAAVNTNVKGTEEKLGVKLGKLTETPVVTELIVSDVMSTNLRELVVNFNIAVDKTTATDKANYTLSKGTVEKVTLSEDMMTATLTVSGLANQDSVKVEVKKVMDEAKALTVATNENTITMFDATIPVADSIKLTGPKTFEITFSEPIKETGTITINNGVYGVAVTTSNLTNVVRVELAASSLAEGDYTVKIDGNFKDFAGYPAMAKSFVLTYAKETVAPTVTLDKASQTQVVVKFDEKVNLAGMTQTEMKKYFYHTFSSYNPLTVTPSADGKEYTLTFVQGTNAGNRPLPEGTVNVEVLYTDGTTAIADEWGNKMTANVTLTAEITADKTAPTVAKVEPVKGQQAQIGVFFSEDVTVATSNFVVKDADGKEVTVSGVSTASKQTDNTYKVVLTMSKNLSGTYTVEIKNVKDMALAPNTIVAVTMSVSIDDMSNPDFTSAAFKVLGITGSGDTKTAIYVYYPEKMAVTGSYSVLAKDNYKIGTADLHADAKVEMFKDGKVVKITLENTSSVNGQNLNIARVADLNGNLASGFQETKQIVTASASIAISKVEQVDYRTVKITLPTLLLNPTFDAFSITNGTTGTLASISNVTVDTDGNTVITGILKSAEQFKTTSATNSVVTSATIVANKLKTDLGVVIATNTQGTVNDAWAPKYVSKAITTQTTSNGTILTGSVTSVSLKFAETLTNTNSSFFGNDLLIKDKDGKALTNGIDYTTSLTTSSMFRDTITVTFSKNLATKVTVEPQATINYIKDIAGNKASSFDLLKFEY